MKFYLEILKETFIPSSDPLQKKEIKVETIISSTEYNTKAKAEKAYQDKSIETKETKQIHQCFHDETNPRPCVIIHG